MKKKNTLVAVFTLLFFSNIYSAKFETDVSLINTREGLKNEVADYLKDKISYYSLGNSHFSYSSDVNFRKRDLSRKVTAKLDPFFVVKAINNGALCRFDFNEEYPDLSNMDDELNKLLTQTLSELKQKNDAKDFIQYFGDYIIKVSDYKFQYDSFKKLFPKSKYPNIKKGLEDNYSLIDEIYKGLDGMEFCDASPYQLTILAKSEIPQRTVPLNEPQVKVEFEDNIVTLSTGNSYEYYSKRANNFQFPNRNLKINNVSKIECGDIVDFNKSSSFNISTDFITYTMKIDGVAKVQLHYLYDKSKPLKGIVFEDKHDQILNISYSEEKISDNSSIVELIDRVNETFKVSIKLENNEFNVIHYTIQKNKTPIKDVQSYYDSDYNFVAFNDLSSSAYIDKNNYYYFRKKRKISLNFELSYPPYNVCSPFNSKKNITEYVFSQNSKPYDTPVRITESASNSSILKGNYQLEITNYIMCKSLIFPEEKNISTLITVEKYGIPYKYIFDNNEFIIKKYIQ